MNLKEKLISISQLEDIQNKYNFLEYSDIRIYNGMDKNTGKPLQRPYTETANLIKGGEYFVLLFTRYLITESHYCSLCLFEYMRILNGNHIFTNYKHTVRIRINKNDHTYIDKKITIEYIDNSWKAYLNNKTIQLDEYDDYEIVYLKFKSMSLLQSE